MSRLVPKTLATMALLAGFGVPGLAICGEIPLLDGAEISLAQPAGDLSSAETMNADDMANMSGGTDITTTVNSNSALSHQELTANSTGNSIEATNLNMVSGAVNFDAGALSNFNGIGNFVVNTGANNVLQGSINVTIATTTPAP